MPIDAIARGLASVASANFTDTIARIVRARSAAYQWRHNRHPPGMAYGESDEWRERRMEGRFSRTRGDAGLKATRHVLSQFPLWPYFAKPNSRNVDLSSVDVLIVAILPS